MNVLLKLRRASVTRVRCARPRLTPYTYQCRHRRGPSFTTSHEWDRLLQWIYISALLFDDTSMMPEFDGSGSRSASDLGCSGQVFIPTLPGLTTCYGEQLHRADLTTHYGEQFHLADLTIRYDDVLHLAGLITILCSQLSHSSRWKQQHCTVLQNTPPS